LVARDRENAEYRTGVCIASLLYSIGVVLREPFLDVHQLSEIVVAAFVLVPLLLAIAYLVRWRAWIAVAGIALFVVTSSAMIASNGKVNDAGSGFFGWWNS